MAAKLWPAGDGVHVFECPACGYGHAVHVGKPNPNGAQWTWNGSVDAPTFHPSLLVNQHGDGDIPRCHSWVKDGKIQFCLDSTHDLKGQTVELPDVEPLLP